MEQEKKKRIFVVEDESIVSLEIQDRLRDLGYEVAGTASSGEQALDRIPKTNPDLVMMDIMLKGQLDGIDTAGKLKNMMDIPIIFLTAYADQNTLDRAKVREPYGYIIKPFEERELHTTIEIALYKFDTQKKMREKDQWLSTILKSIGDAVIATDKFGKVSFLNHIAESLTGYTEEEAIGKNLEEVFNIINEYTGEKVVNPVDKVLVSRKIVGLANHTALISKTGKIIPIMDSAAPIIDDRGEISGAVLIFQDMTERKISEKQLLQSEKKYKHLVENLPEIIYTFSTKQGILYISPMVNKILGYDQQSYESSSSSWKNHIHPQDIPKFEYTTNHLMDGDIIDLEYRMTDIDNNMKWLHDKITVVEVNNDEIIYQGLATDITAQKLAQEKINLQQSALNSAYNGIFITDNDGKIVWCNEAITRISGFPRDEILGSTPRLFKSDVHDKSFYHKLWEDIKAGKVWRGEIINCKKDGCRYFEEVTITPVKNSGEEITHFIAIKQDITERKEFENEIIEAKEKAEKSDKLKSEFLAQMSHEIRTPISSILSFTNLLRAELIESIDEDLKISFDMIDQGGKRLIRTIDLILNMSAIQTKTYQIDIKPMNMIDEIINPILKEFKSTDKNKRVELNLINEIGSEIILRIDEYSISQIFVNLIDNALKYTKSGKVDIIIRNGFKGNIEVLVKDTGIGISKEYIPKIFEPFSQEYQGYTRKYEGNGLGLALVKNYCDINNVKITVISEKNKGTEFKLSFSHEIKSIALSDIVNKELSKQ